MGYTFKLSSLNKEEINKLLSPVVFCIDEEKAITYVKDYKILSINGVLSKRLLEHERDKHPLFVADEFYNIINQAGERLLIKNFEILFNPEYQIDVLKLFIMANRRNKISVLWCGKYKNGKLIFAEPGYQDYKSYHINDYDISCII